MLQTHQQQQINERVPSGFKAATSRQEGSQRFNMGDGMVRETFVLLKKEAREKARAWLEAYPSEAYWSRVEHWRELPDGKIEFTMVRLPNAD